MTKARCVAYVSGRVQGVGFRWWVMQQARELDLCGAATNLYDGRVEVVMEGERGNCYQLLERLIEQPSRHQRAGRVDFVEETWEQPKGEKGFGYG